MNLKQFEAFYWIARLGSFHAAARHLEMTQPSVSARVRELERHLGVALFDRSGRKARLTAKGRELLAYADRMLQLAGEAEQHVGTRAALVGRVRFGVTSIPAVTWMPRLMRRLARAYPGIEAEYAVDNSESLRARLLAGELDMAFLAGPLFEPSLVTETLGRVPMAWLAGAASLLPHRTLTPADLVDEPLITDWRGSFLHSLALSWFTSAGIEPRRHHACASLRTRLDLARAGLGVAMAPATAATSELGAGELRLLAVEPALPALDYVIARPAGTSAPALRAFLELARQVITETPAYRISGVADRSTQGGVYGDQ